MTNPMETYQRRRGRYQKLHTMQNRALSRISNLRLFVFLFGAVTAGVFYYYNRNLTGTILLFLFGAGFVAMVILHNREKAKAQFLAALVELNIQSEARLKGEWRSFTDTGAEFVDQEHPYTGDLDIFGQGSLFQHINTARTLSGRLTLAEILSHTPIAPELIRERQEAIGELAGRVGWRQRYQAEASMGGVKRPDPAYLYHWARETYPFYRQQLLILLIRILPVITIALLVIPLFTSAVSNMYGFLAAGLQFVLVGWGYKDRAKILTSVYRYEESLRSYAGMARLVEKARFRGRHLREISAKLIGNSIASEGIRKLSKITDLVSNRYSSLYLVVNILTLWDYQCMIALENWKVQYGLKLKGWIEAMGQLEALASLALIRYDNRDWVWPEISGEKPHLTAKAMGHPLLEKRVHNDLEISRPAAVLLITGSNMSGKSTLLRTAGINLVLAYAGAPVCAEQFSASLMELYTSMRVSDNLEKSISSFYAELQRIKLIVEAARIDRQIFFLLDEIFKGTNSEDRHLGAKILIKQLAQAGALGIVSTHDLELAGLEAETQGQIKNYHFRESYREDMIKFDYTLRTGVSKTRNALYLIKLAGIEVPEE